jgi:hypothetical protein
MTEIAPQASDQHLPIPSESLLDSSDQFQMLANPYDRMEYVHLTDRLIHRLEGSEEQPRPDFVIFLDKSARPVSWLVRELWDDMAREPGTDFDEHVVPKRPHFVFLNIDSKHMFTKEDMPGLRSLFTIDQVDDLEKVGEMPTHFDGKRVLVVDEIGVSHATRVKAQAYIETAFPDAEVDSFTWMDQGPQTNYGGQGRPPRFNPDNFEFEGEYGLPPKNLTNNLRWYKDRSRMQNLPLAKKREYDDGRGIIDQDAATDEELAQLERPRIRHGKAWLSIAPKERMPQTRQLLKEIKLLGQELREGRLPYWPAEDRLDFEDRLRVTTGLDPESFREFREWFKHTWWKNWEDAMPAIKFRRPDQISYKRATKLGKGAFGLVTKLGLYD